MVKDADGNKLLCPVCESPNLKRAKSRQNEIKGDESVPYYICQNCGDEFVEEDAFTEDE